MTLTLTVPPEVEAKLRNRAAATGQPPDIYACDILTKALTAPEPASDPPLAENSRADDDHRLRGVSAVELPREAIFTQELNFRVEDLPKWKPQMFVGRRAFAEDEDA